MHVTWVVTLVVPISTNTITNLLLVLLILLLFLLLIFLLLLLILLPIEVGKTMMPHQYRQMQLDPHVPCRDTTEDDRDGANTYRR